jgi:hypothetical protein
MNEFLKAVFYERERLTGIVYSLSRTNILLNLYAKQVNDSQSISYGSTDKPCKRIINIAICS